MRGLSQFVRGRNHDLDHPFLNAKRRGRVRLVALTLQAGEQHAVAIQVIEEAAAWRKASLIRAYAEHIAASTKEPSVELLQWLTWAQYTADAIDPTANRIRRVRPHEIGIFSYQLSYQPALIRKRPARRLA